MIEDKVNNYNEEIRKLSKHLHNIREEEKGRIARQIHDELGQILTTLKMDLSYLAEEIQMSSPAIFERIMNALRLTDNAINSARQISSELRVPLLDHLGLIPAIEWLISEFEKRNNIICSKILPKNLSIEKEKSIAIFRIIQELLLNISKHAKATKTSIEISIIDNYMNLIIEDNGIGIDDEILVKSNSLGLISVKERVNLLGGEIKIESKKNKGTKFSILLPLKENQYENTNSR